MLEVIDKGSCTDAHPVPLLFVHGGWHGAWCWENFLDFFADAGYRAVAVEPARARRQPDGEATATPAGSDEEADYLGLPGLLDADQMRALLHRRQDEQLQRRAASGQGVPSAPPSMHGQLRELRRELNTLVSATQHRTGKPHGWIHSELRRRCGGPPIAAPTREQIQARIEALRRLNAEHS